DEPVSEPQRLPRCSAPTLGPKNRDRRKRSPNTPVNSRGGGIRPDGQAGGGKSDHKAQALPPDATVMTQTWRQTSDFDRRTGDPEPARRYRCVGGTDAANPRPGTAPDRVRRGLRDSETAHREPGGTP